MGDFKLLGGSDPAISSLGQMTQGLGYPLREVEPSTQGGTVTVKNETVFRSENFLDQEPAGLGIAMQIAFGPADASPEWSVDAAGLFTCLVEDEYGFRLKITIGREGASGESQIYLRAMLNGAQVGVSEHSIIDNSRIEIPQTIDTVGDFIVGDTLAFEIVRDTDGDNSGGLRAGIPDVVGWAPSPSALLAITRTYAIQT